MKKPFLSVRELVESDLWPGDTTEAAIRAMVARKQIPFRKANGKIYFIRDEVEEWLRTRDGNPLSKRRRPNPEIVQLAEVIQGLDTASIKELKTAIAELTLAVEFQNI